MVSLAADVLTFVIMIRTRSHRQMIFLLFVSRGAYVDQGVLYNERAAYAVHMVRFLAKNANNSIVGHEAFLKPLFYRADASNPRPVGTF